MKHIVTLNTDAVLETPPEARAGDVAEALLQEFTAFLANRPGLRARKVEAACGREVRGYVQTDGTGEPVKPAVTSLEVAR